jgi:quinol monooxygenase YgiN
MIIRVVQMTFQQNRADDFLEFISGIRHQIRNFPGCEHLDIFREIEKGNIFISTSHWKSTEALNQYRKSALFKTTWSRVREWFSEKPRAWSLEKV